MMGQDNHPIAANMLMKDYTGTWWGKAPTLGVILIKLSEEMDSEIAATDTDEEKYGKLANIGIGGN